jgi:iron complex outermembrane receptor protein
MTRRWTSLLGILLTALSAGAQDLATLSLEELMDLEVMTASRQEEPLFPTAAAVAVLTRADIERSGATTIPDLLRLVPGVQVARVDANKWAVSARGFNGRFASRLLVLVDGRSVYTTIFSGVHWEHQDLLLDDIERIEVVRGPGGVVWGANAVNGVINIVTRSASGSDPGTLSVTAGTRDLIAGLRQTVAAPGAGRLRLSAKLFQRGAGPDSTGELSDDDWRVARLRGRADWERGTDRWTADVGGFVGDLGQTVRVPIMEPPFLQTLTGDSRRAGVHALLRWKRAPSAGTGWQGQLFVDRFTVDDEVLDLRHTTWDAEVQRNRRLPDGPLGQHDIVWGVGHRVYADDLAGSTSFMLDPPRRTIHLSSAYLQDDITLGGDLRLRLGSRLERHTFSGVQWQPNARLAWTPGERHALWGSLSRAVRNPSRGEREGVLTLAPLAPDSLFEGSPLVLPLVTGNDEVDPEIVHSVEAGWRTRLREELLLDLALFQHEYDGIISGLQRLPTATGQDYLVADVPVGNPSDVTTRGWEIAADWRPYRAARLRASWSRLFIDFDDSPQAVPREGRGDKDNPEHQAVLWGSLDAGAGWQLDGIARYVSALPALGVRSRLGVDLSARWRLREGLTLTVSGRNLLTGRRKEFQTLYLNSLSTWSTPTAHATITWSPAAGPSDGSR